MNEFIINVIFFIVVTFLFLAISQLNWNFNPIIKPPKLVQQVTLETMDNMYVRINPIDSFCDSFLGDASNLDGACKRLTKDSCFKTDCCVYTDENKCVAGSEHGPTFKTDPEGNSIENRYFYHLGVKY